MKVSYFIRSSTVNLERYTIKDIAGSSGRLDVISRTILAALFDDGEFEKNVSIWVFLEKYGTFVFDSKVFDIESFPKNEILFSDFFVKFIIDNTQPNPLEMIKRKKLDVFDALESFINQNYQVFILQEDGQDFYPFFKKFSRKSNLLFIIGNQIGDLISSKELNRFNLTRISLGTQSYLASSVVRLINLNLKLII